MGDTDNVIYIVHYHVHLNSLHSLIMLRFKTEKHEREKTSTRLSDPHHWRYSSKMCPTDKTIKKIYATFTPTLGGQIYLTACLTIFPQSNQTILVFA